MITSKVTSKGQITLPKEVRQALGISTGDRIAYRTKDNVVILRKVEPFNAVWHAALSSTMEEWNSPENDEAWHDL